jgi:hypothetical protein
MRLLRIPSVIAILAVFAVVVLTSCEDGSGNPANPAPTARIVGTVVRSNSGPVANAQVSTDPVTQTVLTAADGTFEIRSVPNGSYIVKAVSGGSTGSATVSLTSGQTGRADIVLTNGPNDSTGGPNDTTGGPNDTTGGPNDSTGGPRPVPGLIAHFTLDGHAHDVSNNFPTGRINGASPAMNRRGEQGKAMRFDGVNDYIEVDVHGDNRIQQFPMTWAVWLRHDPGTKNEWPVGRYLHPNGDGVGFFWENGKFSSFYSTDFFSNWCRIDASAPSDGRWYHAAFTLTQQGMVLYINGRVAEDMWRWVGTPMFSRSTQPLRFGIINSVHPTMPPDAYRGDIDDFMIFDRALSPEEIMRLAKP